MNFLSHIPHTDAQAAIFMVVELGVRSHTTAPNRAMERAGLVLHYTPKNNMSIYTRNTLMAMNVPPPAYGGELLSALDHGTFRSKERAWLASNELYRTWT